ncbi:MAG: protein translocase subunit SecD [Thermaerobacter sp.]|nr:protein translocase subunit SecD [Thermaerobacter sp.]
MRRRSTILLAVVVAVLIAAGYYFSILNPITRHLTYGLDLKGGVTATYQAEPTPGAPVNSQTMARAMQIMSFRVNSLGVSEPVVQQVGSNRITIDLPGVKNPEQALAFLGKTALLQIKSPTGQVLLTGNDLKTAAGAISQGQNVVELTFDAKGTTLFRQATTKYLGKTLPIYLDGKLLEAPTVSQVIPNGQAQMTGGFKTLKDAQRMALLLQSGALPVNLKVLDVRTVSATLGQAAVQASKLAATIAIVLIALAMVVWYRLAGVVADIALFVYLNLILGALWALHAVVTVPGIAGIILSVGMAVDANVIMFARIREEMANGKTPGAAVAGGYRHAIRAILDSHVTTFFSSLILFYLGTGEVRGFALTLMIGTVISLFTAVTVSGMMIRWVAEAGLARVRALFVG